ncbi:MAG: hypothetical protein ACR2KP_18110 [Egibacteraceae bacterium]
MVLASCLVALVPGVAAAESRVSGDFNGDGTDDLAIGVPGEGFGGNDFAGVVQVIYGSTGPGLAAPGNQLWHQDSPGIKEVAEDGDQFGSSLAAGDFDGDGTDDLAIGAHFETFGGNNRAGVVQVLYGTAGGLDAAGNQLWSQDSPQIKEVAEGGDFFGEALAAGDFDGDGVDDLAIGAPGESFGGKDSAGVVQVLYGTSGGLAAAGNQLWHQDSPGIKEVAESADRFGEVLPGG